jgi:N utilization substance protein A
MTTSPFMAAINQIADEKNLDKNIVLDVIAAAIAVAYRKDYGRPQQQYRAELDPDSGEVKKIFLVKKVVEEVEDEESQITLEDARKIKPDVELEGTIEFQVKLPEGFGRIAAQTAKQVIIQRLREAERDVVFKEFKDKENTVLIGTVQRIEGSNIIVDLGRANGTMFPSEQVPGERYYIGQRIKVYIVRVEETSRGPQIVVSRAHPGLVRHTFMMEVPEIEAGTVVIKGIAREPGARSKVAVAATQEGVDPVGSCVGQRGTRVQAIIAELGQEKIDIVLFDEEPIKYIENALAPAKITKVILNEKEKQAYVYVDKDQLSLAIGSKGQNVRLASKLTGYRLDVVEASEEVMAKLEEELKKKEQEAKKPKKKVEKEEVIEEVGEAVKKVEKKVKPKKKAKRVESENKEK